MKFEIKINGIMIHAEYSTSDINDIFLPLLRQLTKLQKRKNRRILVYLAAPPGAGKSTLAGFLEYLSETEDDLTPLTAIGMDGFHMLQDYLLTHEICRDGKPVRMVDVKGSPETFDLEKLKAAIERVKAGETCGWPLYDRLKHNPIEDVIRVSGDIVLIEGNYLLLETSGWSDLKQFADHTIYVSAEEEMLEKRLLDRKIKSGASPEEAKKFVKYSDMANVRVCLEHSHPADFMLFLKEDGTYRI